jgi:hypothetical protein
MVRIRHGSLVIGLGLALALGTACKKDSAGDQNAGTPSGLTGNAASAEDLGLIPRDSEVVLGINLSQVQQSALWKQFVEPKLMSGDAAQKMAKFKAKCGIDPMSAVKSISVGVKGITSNKPEGVVVIHGMDKTKAMSCLDSMKDEIAADGTEMTRDGDVVLLKNTKTNSQIALSYINDGTALAVFGEQVTAASVKAAQASNQTLKSSQPFLEMYKKITTSDSLWLLLSGKVLERGASFGMKASAVFGSLNVTDGLTLDLRLRFDTPDAAAQFASLGKSQAQQAAKMFDKIDITTDDKEVRVAVVLSSQKLQALIAQLTGLLSAFGGMGGQ